MLWVHRATPLQNLGRTPHQTRRRWTLGRFQSHQFLLPFFQACSFVVLLPCTPLTEWPRWWNQTSWAKPSQAQFKEVLYWRDFQKTLIETRTCRFRFCAIAAACPASPASTNNVLRFLRQSCVSGQKPWERIRCGQCGPEALGAAIRYWLLLLLPRWWWWWWWSSQHGHIDMSRGPSIKGTWWWFQMALPWTQCAACIQESSQVGATQGAVHVTPLLCLLRGLQTLLRLQTNPAEEAR